MYADAECKWLHYVPLWRRKFFLQWTRNKNQKCNEFQIRLGGNASILSYNLVTYRKYCNFEFYYCVHHTVCTHSLHTDHIRTSVLNICLRCEHLAGCCKKLLCLVMHSWTSKLIVFVFRAGMTERVRAIKYCGHRRHYVALKRIYVLCHNSICSTVQPFEST